MQHSTKSLFISCITLSFSLLLTTGFVLAADEYSNLPREGTTQSAVYTTPIKSMEPKNLPEFATGASTALQTGLQSSTLPTSTRMNLVVECVVDAKTSKPGDIFEAHVKNDLVVGNTLILPRGSLVRGRVVEVNKPRLISRAAKIGLRLEQIVTPTGETVPMDAALEFRKGMTNQKGQLDPGTSFSSRVGDDMKAVTGISATGNTRKALIAANIATLGAPAAATLIGGSAIAVFRAGDNISLTPGQELDILLTNDMGVQLN